MRFLLLTALSAVCAIASSIPGLPTCAGNCVGTNFGGCGSLNITCICSNGPLLKNLACCVSVECDTADQKLTIEFADAFCGSDDVTGLPTAATCAPGAVSTPQTGSATGSTTGSATDSTAASSTATSGSATTTGGTSGSTTGSSSSGSTAAATTAASTSASSSGSMGNTIEAAGWGIGAMIVGALAAM